MGKWSTQSDSKDTTTKVSSSTNRDTGRAQTEIIIADKSDGGNHTHVAIDSSGNTTYGRSGT
jgi:hypothetical protein